MRTVKVSDIALKVEEMLKDACYNIPSNVLEALKKAKEDEESELGKEVIERIIENDLFARKECLPMCQDTGIVVVFVRVGYDVHFDGDLYDAINEGVRNAYINGYLRKSVVKHPLDRVNTKDNTPAVIHVEFEKGDQVKIDVAPKGGGSENMSIVKILIPADGVEGIKKQVLDVVLKGGGKPCPPIIVGLGIGGNLEKSAILAKKALLREIDDVNEDPLLDKLEIELKDEINKLGVGPMGFGGTQTCLAVKALAYPCHIASLPLAINIQCHAARHKSCVL